MRSVLGLFQALEVTTNALEADALVDELSRSPREGDEELVVILKQKIDGVVHSYLLRAMGEGEELYYNSDVLPLRDLSGFLKVSLFLSALQDYRSPKDSFEEELSELLLKMIKEFRLSSIISDITVNSHQVRMSELR